MNRHDQERLSQCAAAYVRMSTEHQRYSTGNQLEVIRVFAQQRNWSIVAEYADEGKSGLKIEGRAALERLIGDVVGRKANFAHILVYDVSRWGRFQDPDEAAHYEFICAQAGVIVHYCAEQFQNDGGLISNLAKILKRAMAGEFSRELSAKVFQGACRLIQLGYKQGGPAAFGLRRMLVDPNGQPKGILKLGEQKSLALDRVILVPGPEAEVKAVRWMFEMFATGRECLTGIARRLNEQGIPSTSGHPWRDDTVQSLLRNENYIGNLVYSRSSQKLRSRRRPNPPETWIRKENAFEGLVSRELFFKAQDRFAANPPTLRMTSEELLDQLRGLLKAHGYLSADLIRTLQPAVPLGRFYYRFGTLTVAYRLVGFKTRPENPLREVFRRLRLDHRKLVDELMRRFGSLGVTAAWNRRAHALHINHEIWLGVAFAVQCAGPSEAARWTLRWDGPRWERIVMPDLMLLVRMDRHNERIEDYYLLPWTQYKRKTMWFNERDGVHLDAYRFPTLGSLLDLAARGRYAKT